MSKPMPSPNGTNVEKLYLDQTGLAMDSASSVKVRSRFSGGRRRANRLAMDDAPSLCDKDAYAILGFLHDKLSPEDLALARAKLKLPSSGGGKNAADVDQPPEFEGEQRTGGGHATSGYRDEVTAMDRAITSRARSCSDFTKRHPEMARIKAL